MYVCIFLVSFSCSNDENENSSDAQFYKPSGVITQDRATELSAAWNNKNTTVFSKAGKAKSNDEIQSNWWSLEDLRNYLDFAEHEAEEKGYNMTGIRVYFAAYPDKGNQNTMFFAPTGHKSISEASSFNLNFLVAAEDIPIPPLNDGNGGNGGYPQ